MLSFTGGVPGIPIRTFTHTVSHEARYRSGAAEGGDPQCATIHQCLCLRLPWKRKSCVLQGSILFWKKVQNTDSTVRHTKATESMKSPEKFILFG